MPPQGDRFCVGLIRCKLLINKENKFAHKLFMVSKMSVLTKICSSLYLEIITVTSLT